MTSSGAPPLQVRASSTRGSMFGDLSERRVVIALESSARLALAMPAVRRHVNDALLRLAHRNGDTAFGLVVGSKPTVFGGSDDKLTPATQQSVTEAVAWLADQPCRSTSDHLASLLAAFRPSECQAVWLVACSPPADAAEAESVLDHAAYLSRGRPVHCVCLRLPGDRDGREASRLLDFMDRLAADTCGSLTAVQIDESQAVASVQCLRGSEGPAERIIRTKDSRLRPELATCSVTTRLRSGVDPLLEPPVLPLPAGLRSFSRYRPARAFISAGAVSGASDHPFCPTGGATLVGRRVLARRRDKDSGYYRGRVVSEVEPDIFLVEFPGDQQQLEHQETRIGDLVSLDDALRHPIAPEDTVLVPAPEQPGQFQLGLVLRGHESRGAASAGDDVSPLIVAMATRDAEVEVAPGEAVWIPRQLYDGLLAERSGDQGDLEGATSSNSSSSSGFYQKPSTTVIMSSPGLMYVYPSGSLVAVPVAVPLMLNSGAGRDFPISSHAAPFWFRPLHVLPRSSKPPPPPPPPPPPAVPETNNAKTSAPEAKAEATAATKTDEEISGGNLGSDKNEEAELLALDRELAAAFGTREVGVGEDSVERRFDKKRPKKPEPSNCRGRPPWRYWGAGGVGCGANSSSGMPDVVELFPADRHVNWGRCDPLERRLNPSDQARPRLRPGSPRRLLDPRLFDRFGDPVDRRMTREQAAEAAASAKLQTGGQWRRRTVRDGADDFEAAGARMADRSRQLEDAQVKHELHRLDRQQRSEAAVASFESAIRAQLQREAQLEAQAYRRAVQEELQRSRSGDYRIGRSVGYYDGPLRTAATAAAAVARDLPDPKQSRVVENASAQRTVAEWLRYQDLMDSQQAATSAQTMAARHRDCHSALESQRLLRHRQAAI